MIIHNNVHLTASNRILDDVTVEIDETVENNQRVHIILIGKNKDAVTLHMSWTQFEEFMKIMILRSGEEYARRERIKNEQSKNVRSLNLELGDSIKLEDKLGE